MTHNKLLKVNKKMTRICLLKITEIIRPVEGSAFTAEIINNIRTLVSQQASFLMSGIIQSPHLQCNPTLNPWPSLLNPTQYQCPHRQHLKDPETVNHSTTNFASRTFESVMFMQPKKTKQYKKHKTVCVGGLYCSQHGD